MGKTFFRDEVLLKNYTRQYMGLYNCRGHKVIFVGFFLVDNAKEFRVRYRDIYLREFFTMDDGLHTFFTVKFNVKKQSFYDFEVNGE